MPRSCEPCRATLNDTAEALKTFGIACTELAKRRLTESGGELVFSKRPTFKEFAIRVGRPAREVIGSARARGVHPGYAIGRDYEGMDDVLLVALTEKRTPADVERLAGTLAEVAGWS